MNEAAQTVPRERKEIKLSPKDEDRFWAKVDKSGGPDACWLWMASRNRKGYGGFRIGRRIFKTHRIAWTLANGSIPHDGSHNGICACHRCDNPSCVNPAHLFLGTNAQNNKDKESKGRGNPARGDKNGARIHPERMLRGEAQTNSKLKTEQAIGIRALYDTGRFTQKELADTFNVSRTLISFIINRKAWRHI